MTFEIKEPIWNVRHFMPNTFGRGVGLDKAKIGQEDAIIDILYKNRAGERVYPRSFKLARFKVDLMPIKKIKGKELVIVPLSELEVMN